MPATGEGEQGRQKGKGRVKFKGCSSRITDDFCLASKSIETRGTACRWKNNADGYQEKKSHTLHVLSRRAATEPGHDSKTAAFYV